jgi:DNA-binding beta-propeller fold protein YncE
MTSTRIQSYLILSLCIFIASCAETKMVMNMSPERVVVPTIVWPASPEKPRYRYIGELTGEANFRPDSDILANRSKVAKLFDWLVGLRNTKVDPIVLQRPQCGVVDSEGRIFVTDISKGAVYVFDKPAGKLAVWEMAGLNSHFKSPVGITLGEQGEVLVADADLRGIFRLDNKGNPIGGFGQDVLIRPTGLARDTKRGYVYVADTYAHDIKVFQDDGKLVKKIGQRGEADGEFNFPTHITFANDQLYVTDTLNSRIQVFDAEGKLVKKFGQRGLYVGNLVRPKGVAVDNFSNIYVIESLYDQLLVFNPQGETLLALGGNGKEIGQFYLPAGVWVDQQNQVYIADMFNGRITVLQYLGDSQ